MNRPLPAPVTAGLVALVVALAAALAGCDGGAADDDETLRVLAASSLTGSFDELAAAFESQHGGVDVVAVYDSSATLATQVSEGAPADVLATADLETMQRVVDAGDADGAVSFAANSAVLVTPHDAKALVSSLEDLRAGVRYVVCVESAPCGKVAQELLQLNDVQVDPVSYEDNVKAVLEKVKAGEADAGIVYVTDARAAAEDVSSHDIPGADQVVTEYAIAAVQQARNRTLAQEFIDFVLSSDGQDVLREAGFAPVSGEVP